MGPPTGRGSSTPNNDRYGPSHNLQTQSTAPSSSQRDQYLSRPVNPHQQDRLSGQSQTQYFTRQPQQQSANSPVNNQDTSQLQQPVRRRNENQQFESPSSQVGTQYQTPSYHQVRDAVGETTNMPLEPISDSEERQPIDTTDGHHVNVNVSVSTEKEVCESTPGLLTSFLVDRMEYDGFEVPHGLASRRRRNESDIAHVLRRMGDDISRNSELNRYIAGVEVTPHTAYKTFASVACQIFTDGTINWGRIVMLFYFAYKLALKVLNQLPLIDLIINWVTTFITQKLASWISSRGGWGAIREYYGSTTGQMVGVFLAGILISTLFWYWKK